MVLYTDGMFREAAPEVVSAWRGLGPWKDAEVRDLPNSDEETLAQSLRQDTGAQPQAVLVGMALSAGDRHRLGQSFPHQRFIFLGPAPGDESITINPVERWDVVARAAATRGGPATVLFPPGTPPADQEHFAQTWSRAGGGPLTAGVWPDVVTLKIASGTVFQWVGVAADSRVAALNPRVVIAGDPGVSTTPGAGGVTWRIRSQGLGDFLWAAAQSSGKNSHFLPMETLPFSR